MGRLNPHLLLAPPEYWKGEGVRNLFPPTLQAKATTETEKWFLTPLAGTAQTGSTALTTGPANNAIDEAEVPAIARFAWSGLQIDALFGLILLGNPFEKNLGNATQRHLTPQPACIILPSVDTESQY